MADFATVAELELRTGMVGLGARGTAILGDVSAQIRLYTGQDLEATTGRQEEFAAEWNRYYLSVSQRPVTALTMTVNTVAFTDMWVNYMSGDVYRNDGLAWDEGPILITYDSGYDSTSDQMAGVKAVCIEVAARALGGLQDTFGLDVVETRGTPYVLSLTDEEKGFLDRFGLVGVG